jgi:hypothetical protein
MDEFKQVVAVTGGAVLVINAGYTSINGDVKVAETNACVLVNVITKSVVPPALMVVGEKVFDTVGLLGVMESLSAAVHVPVAQPKPPPVFVTPDGTEIVAVLVTWLCAKPESGIKDRNSAANRQPMSLPALKRPHKDAKRRLNTFFLLFSNEFILRSSTHSHQTT